MEDNLKIDSKELNTLFNSKIDKMNDFVKDERLSNVFLSVHEAQVSFLLHEISRLELYLIKNRDKMKFNEYLS